MTSWVLRKALGGLVLVILTYWLSGPGVPSSQFFAIGGALLIANTLGYADGRYEAKVGTPWVRPV